LGGNEFILGIQKGYEWSMYLGIEEQQQRWRRNLHEADETKDAEAEAEERRAASCLN